MRRIHGSEQHQGKFPGQDTTPIVREKKIRELDWEVKQLKAQLSKAVKVENFELAAKLRDKIKSLTANQIATQENGE